MYHCMVLNFIPHFSRSQAPPCSSRKVRRGSATVLQCWLVEEALGEIFFLSALSPLSDLDGRGGGFLSEWTYKLISRGDRWSENGLRRLRRSKTYFFPFFYCPDMKRENRKGRCIETVVRMNRQRENVFLYFAAAGSQYMCIFPSHVRSAGITFDIYPPNHTPHWGCQPKPSD